MTLATSAHLVDGRVPLVIEVKSHFDGDRKLVKRMAEVLSSYKGPAVGMSFDPDQVVALREIIPSRPHGIVAEHDYTQQDWPEAFGPAAPRDDASAPLLPHPPRISSPTGSTNCRPLHPGLRAMCSAARC